MQRSKARLDHLTALTQTTTTSDDAYLRWSQIRLDRILVDYMLRQGYTKTAKRLAADSHIEELVDIELFEQTKVVEDSLRLYGCTECLAWCNENKTALRKAKVCVWRLRGFGRFLSCQFDLVDFFSSPRAISFTANQHRPTYALS